MNIKKNLPILLGLGIAAIVIAKRVNPEPRGKYTPCKYVYDKVVKGLKFVCTFHNPEAVFGALRRDVLGK